MCLCPRQNFVTRVTVIKKTSDLRQQHKAKPRERDMPKGNVPRANYHAVGKNSNRPGSV